MERMDGGIFMADVCEAVCGREGIPENRGTGKPQGQKFILILKD